MIELIMRSLLKPSVNSSVNNTFEMTKKIN